MIEKNKLIMIVNNDKLYLALSNQKSDHTMIGTIPFSTVSTSDDLPSIIPAQAKTAQHSTLILPDYFVGNGIYPFTSERRSITEAFIQRKLSESFPDNPEIINFFNYAYTRTGPDTGSLYAFYIQDPIFFRIYQRLTDAGLRPDRIIIPAFIWQHMLGKIVKGASESNLCLIHRLPTESHLYFFLQGRFLFSRNIKFPESATDEIEKLDLLTYEITQSIYLFSQKVKSEIKQFYLVSSVAADLKKMDEKRLSERMEKAVQNIDIGRQESLPGGEIDSPLSGSLAAFSWHDLESEKILAISHRQAAWGKAWEPVQRAGMITGIIVLLLLIAETTYLTLLPRNSDLSTANPVKKGVMLNRHNIQQYHEILDAVQSEQRNPDPAAILSSVVFSLPENVTIQELTFALESPFPIVMTGNVKSDSPEMLRSTLSKMVEKLSRNLKPVRSLSMSDIHFDLEKRDSTSASSGYRFMLQVDLQ